MAEIPSACNELHKLNFDENTCRANRMRICFNALVSLGRQVVRIRAGPDVETNTWAPTLIMTACEKYLQLADAKLDGTNGPGDAPLLDFARDCGGKSDEQIFDIFVSEALLAHQHCLKFDGVAHTQKRQDIEHRLQQGSFSSIKDIVTKHKLVVNSKLDKQIEVSPSVRSTFANACLVAFDEMYKDEGLAAQLLKDPWGMITSGQLLKHKAAPVVKAEQPSAAIVSVENTPTSLSAWSAVQVNTEGGALSIDNVVLR